MLNSEKGFLILYSTIFQETVKELGPTQKYTIKHYNDKGMKYSAFICVGMAVGTPSLVTAHNPRTEESASVSEEFHG